MAPLFAFAFPQSRIQESLVAPHPEPPLPIIEFSFLFLGEVVNFHPSIFFPSIFRQWKGEGVSERETWMHQLVAVRETPQLVSSCMP